jgi:hypothetical protein
MGKLVARFYSIPLRIRINGAYTEKIDCEVPLQVVHTRRMTETNLVPVQEDASLHCLGRAVILSQGDVSQHRRCTIWSLTWVPNRNYRI